VRIPLFVLASFLTLSLSVLDLFLGAGKSGGTDLEDPQQVYNRDREQMERSLDSLRRAMKTETLAHKRDLSKMMRESVLLTKELNTLRKNARTLMLQRKAIDQSSHELTSIENIHELMELLGLQVKNKQQSSSLKAQTAKAPKREGTATGTGGQDQSKHLYLPTGPPTTMNDLFKVKRSSQQSRTTALRTTSADGTLHKANDHSSWFDPSSVLGGAGPGNQNTTSSAAAANIPSSGIAGSPSRAQSRQKHNQSRQDQWEAWREIQIQYDSMKFLEDNLTSLCDGLGLDPIPVLVAVDNQVETL
jgi:hypothetical protein